MARKWNHKKLISIKLNTGGICMKRNKENKRPWPYRFISVVLACAMLFTLSGFQTLAQEASTEIQTESAEEIAARQAAQQAAEEEAARQAAEQAAAQQAAEEEAARQAAEAAAAQQAAEEEAARQAEAQAQAAAAQQAAEEEAARQAAEAAAAQQAANDANTARQQQQQAAVQSQGNYVSSVEQAPVIAGRLVLNVDAASTQETGKSARISVVYGLGSECTLGSIDTRLYVWNKNAAFPQFINGVYTDPISKRIFTLKTDEEGDTYISYSLKPGESFKQVFELTDTTVAAGGSVVFDVAICAMGQIPTDSQIQQTAGKVTYALPAEETQPAPEDSQPVAGESQPVTKESEQYVTIELPEEGTSDTSSTESADTNTSNGVSTEESLIDIVLPGLEEEETGAGTEEDIVWNDVFFEVIEGASVTVDGMDVTNDVAKAKNGTIIFNVVAEEGYEITEVLVDGITPAETTENDGEYIIENINTDETIVTVLTEALETEDALLEEVIESAAFSLRLMAETEEKSYDVADNRNTLIYSYTVDGKPYKQGTAIERDAEVDILLKYYFAPVNNPTVDDHDKYYIELPSIGGLDYNFISNNGDILSPNWQDVGDFKIEGNKVNFDYDPKALVDKDGKPLSSFAGTFTLSFKVDKNSTAGETEIEIELPGTEKIIIPLKEPTVSGTKSDYIIDADGNLIFTITLTADADVTNVVVTDTLTGSFEFIKDSFEATNVTGFQQPVISKINNGEQAVITIGEMKYGSPVVITYKVKPTGGSVNLTGSNEAGIGYGEGEGAGTGTTNTVDIDLSNTILDKNRDLSNAKNNQIQYIIQVNELKADLDGQGAGGTIKLVDRLDTDIFVLVNGTVTIQDDSGNSLLEINPDTGKSYAAYSYADGVLNFEVPDETFVTIKYYVRVKGEVGDKVSVNNMVEMTAPIKKSDFTEDEFEIQRAQATFIGNPGTIVIYKIGKYVEGISQPYLEGAEFELYKINLDTESVSLEGTLVGTWTSDSNGQVALGYVSDGAQGLIVPDELYYFKESKAPDGYIKSDAITYFYISSDDPDMDTAFLEKVNSKCPGINVNPELFMSI